MRLAPYIAALVSITVGSQPALSQSINHRAISEAEAKIAKAKWIHVAWSIRFKPDRMTFAQGHAITEPKKMQLIEAEVSRLLKTGTAAVQGREGPRDFVSYWCSARVAFVLDPPSKPLGVDSDVIEVCGRPGRFMVLETAKFSHRLLLQQPREEIRGLLALAGIKELPDCPEPPAPPLGSDYEDFGFPCW